ncbi:MAG: 23S rRNA (adenine(2503)-C(2))-methyltransferase RlmN [Anaerolineae bacterium]
MVFTVQTSSAHLGKGILKRTVGHLSLYDATLAELGTWFTDRGAAPDRARDVWHWVYRDCDESLLGLPLGLRRALREDMPLIHPTLIKTQESPDGHTRKDLLGMPDGDQVETVLLRYRQRYTVCVSTQVGCACGCRFCATGQMGFVRDLTAGEIIAQVHHFQRLLSEHHHELSNIVLMGMGEPLLNEEQTIRAVERFVDPRAFAFAPRRITLSTVGIPPGIVRLADLHRRLPIKLAVSLHAATDDTRSSLMPINRRYPLDILFEALRYYVETTGRRVFMEWLMIDGVNDTVSQAQALAKRLAGLAAHINLIRLNPTPIFEGRPSRPQAVEDFVAILDRHGIPHTMRQRRGIDIKAGCGQLKANYPNQGADDDQC